VNTLNFFLGVHVGGQVQYLLTREKRRVTTEAVAFCVALSGRNSEKQEI
jgi:hypothetical protein